MQCFVVLNLFVSRYWISFFITTSFVTLHVIFTNYNILCCFLCLWSVRAYLPGLRQYVAQGRFYVRSAIHIRAKDNKVTTFIFLLSPTITVTLVLKPTLLPLLKWRCCRRFGIPGTERFLLNTFLCVLFNLVGESVRKISFYCFAFIRKSPWRCNFSKRFFIQYHQTWT